MPIKILSPQLANQIAAGEVVERPASVVKELVENSLDAGANKIQIDIENGGANLIRIRDNGCGIPKEELSLALARHATSKITDLDDLEAILSLGFRGEALASISSVSRLTLTSRTEEQTEAWQVYAQGRDMETTIKPASHPVGTTVEVANLFFNTPARRKFLRTDKTEFSHIDEVIRRIALTKFNTAFTLTHNGKIIRQYRPAEELTQQLKRVAAICGDDFVKNALRIDWKHDDLHLSGWVATPNFSRTQNDLSYCYINGRMVRDKVISHAIRQAYAKYLPTDVYPAFVLFIDLNPHDVDVNVHPTKHEVRFHQQRLIHDFIYEGVSHALNNQEQLNWHTDQSAVENHEENTVREPQPNYSIRPNRAAAGQNSFAPQYHEKPQQNQPHFSNTPVLPNHVSTGYRDYRSDAPSKTEQRLYAELLRTLPPTAQKDISDTAQQNISDTAKIISTEIIECSSHLRALSLIENRALLLQQNQDFFLLSLEKLQRLQWQLALKQIQIEQQPLLIPIVFRLTESQFQAWQQYSDDFKKIGFEFIENQAQLRLTLNRVPSLLRTQNLQKCVMAMLTRDENSSPFLTALCAQLECKTFNALADALNLLSDTERLLTQTNRTAFTQLLKPVNWQPLLDEI
ncbi:DNA mismatch repair protein MutL [Haemophilus influenzae biotype aegyptius]|uniref:DNA mismatch repair endonuclease MutL n=1 Tax=Haemophilus influenzae TaxID=727 RepID=UPI0002F22436|nr:DNA mismatch repair endonuclease MutL [Haemophilus influenzae]QEQ61962.1 DNA mismatch repair endonuclease MutL [Haemophilus influenzae biotype aegyptius]QEQ62776.1 DNA mismatch repair endonuclease MutL [Haemophilus influenzae biotype aegyptius]QEQ65522.1 DNA mismatch repair endonuclease MutL [Haemophilus influenzae biotype aegyptius]TMQ36008.1 DNA mismatch repair protein MutL [Haemophilus influenzae biotype aegyptius]TMQ39260.1 DNA mismatch repair protein MutL [Haemophilus influenzae biotyp